MSYTKVEDGCRLREDKFEEPKTSGGYYVSPVPA